jgi:hypothetical protein
MPLVVVFLILWPFAAVVFLGVYQFLARRNLL